MTRRRRVPRFQIRAARPEVGLSAAVLRCWWWGGGALRSRASFILLEALMLNNEASDELFWFNDPTVVLHVFRTIMFFNSFNIGLVWFNWWQVRLRARDSQNLMLFACVGKPSCVFVEHYTAYASLVPWRNSCFGYYCANQ